jgi:hypothetical protein
MTRERRLDLALYALSAVFAGVTAWTSTLAPHRAWGAIAVFGYAAAAIAAPFVHRLWLTGVTWVAVCLVPLTVQAVQRAGGRTDRAQEEVVVTELAGRRLLESGTPFLARDDIAELHERLLGYFPYQPGMAIFGLPRAVFGMAWWTDARIWFAIATAAALFGAGRALAATDAAVVRAAQGATVLPICALTLATGGDDLPVLALCLLALALVDRRPALAGLAMGAAGALKLFAWPVALVLLTLVLSRRRAGAARFALAAFGLPVLALVPALIVDAAAVGENLLVFPLGRGVVTSPAQSPLPGYLIANGVPGGRVIALCLLGVAGLAIAVWLLRRPPTDASQAAIVCAVGLTVAILLLPSTRFGYLLYPAAFAFAVQALRSALQNESQDPAIRRTQVA